jgi:elongation factor Tu
MAADSLFRLKVADVFSIKGRGTVVMGLIESGTLKVGDEIEIVRGSGSRQKAVVAGLEMLRKQLPQAGAGDTVGVLLANVGKNDIARGDLLTGFDSEFTWKP